MKKEVVCIHSAGPQRINEGCSGLVAYLAKAFGDEYTLLTPEMPNPESPQYEAWKAQLEQQLAEVQREVILIGHSLGGAVLLKYLSETAHRSLPQITGLYLIAAPYWGKDDDWQGEEYTLSDDFASKLPHIPEIVFYHSHHDGVVPIAHLDYYKNKLPLAKTKILDGEDHYFKDGLPELVDDIKSRVHFKGGNNIALKIPKYKYDETVHFYKNVIQLPYLGFMSESHAFQFGDVTLWLDCMDNYAQQDVWLEIQTDNVNAAADYLRENQISRRDEVEVHENSEGYWISDPSGTILRVNRAK